MKALRIHLKQASANYRREETVKCRMTYPLPPYSTIIGALHNACGYTEYHNMKISVQGKYGSLKKRLFREDCFLNNLQDDRGILVRMKSPDMLSSAYDVVAKAQKNQGNSFYNGVTISVENQELLDEYRRLKKLKEHIAKNKNVVKKYKDKLKKLKADENVSKEQLKSFTERVKQIENVYKKYEEIKYNIPMSYFRILTKAPKYYELLCDVELVIHIVTDDTTLNDILENIHNLTAIGRREDYVEILECCEVELEKVCDDVSSEDCGNMGAYIPLEIIEKAGENFDAYQNSENIIKSGTRFLISKEYTVEQLKGGFRKRNFKKIPVLYKSSFGFFAEFDGVLIDRISDDKYYIVSLA